MLNRNQIFLKDWDFVNKETLIFFTHQMIKETNLTSKLQLQYLNAKKKVHVIREIVFQDHAELSK